MPADLQPEHVCDAAGWALGVLELDDALAFREHLAGCAECEQAVADFEGVATALKRPLPPADLPPGLQERTITAVLQAAEADSHPAVTRLARVRRARRPFQGPGRPGARPLAAMVAAAAAVIAAAIAVPLSLAGSPPAPAVAARMLLRPAAGTAGTAAGQAVVYREPSGFKIDLRLRGLRPTAPGQFYGCWYVGPAAGAGGPDLITAGSFTVGRSGSADVTMWSAADPASFPTMEITVESGSGALPGTPVLTGRA